MAVCNKEKNYFMDYVFKQDYIYIFLYYLIIKTNIYKKV